MTVKIFILEATETCFGSVITLEGAARVSVWWSLIWEGLGTTGRNPTTEVPVTGT